MRTAAEYEAELDRVGSALDYESRWRKVLADGLVQERERSDSFETLAVSRKTGLDKSEALLRRCLPFVEDCEDGDLIADVRALLELPPLDEPADRAIPWDTLSEAMGER